SPVGAGKRAAGGSGKSSHRAQKFLTKAVRQCPPREPGREGCENFVRKLSVPLPLPGLRLAVAPRPINAGALSYAPQQPVCPDCSHRRRGATGAGGTRIAPDAEGCKDVFVSRIVGYYISYCNQMDFDAYKFMEGTDTETSVEGKYVRNKYSQPDDATANSILKVQRNYINALSADGWTLLAMPEGGVTAKQI